MTDPIGIYIVDNQPIAIECLRAVLRTDPRFRMVGFANSGVEALDAIGQVHGVDIVLMDLLMPTLDGMATMQKLREKYPAAEYQIVMLSVENNLNTALQCLGLGAAGYLLRTSDFSLFTDLLVKLHLQRNCVALDPDLVRRKNVTASPVFDEQELKVIELALDEKDSETIAGQLKFRTKGANPKPDKTRVDYILREIKERMGARNLAGLARYALENWVVPNYVLPRPNPPAIPVFPIDRQQKVPVFIVDDDIILLNGLQIALSNYPNAPSIEVVGTATNADQCLDAVAAWLRSPEAANQDRLIVIMDIEMPGRMDGLAATAVLSERHPEVRTIVCTLRDSYQSAREAQANGAKAYVTKSMDMQDLIRVIWAVWHGEEYIGVGCPPSERTFTDEESLIIQMVWDQYTSEEIAHALGWEDEKAKDRVDARRRRIMHKMGVDNVVGMIKYIWLNRVFDGG